VEVRNIFEVGLGEELLPGPGGRIGYGSTDRKLPFREGDLRLESEIEHRPGLDEMLPRRQAIISLVKHFPFFAAPAGLSPLFLGFDESVVLVHCLLLARQAVEKTALTNRER
jgi:hypothetical protein